MLLSAVNLVEIDLLLGGERMPLATPWPEGDRFVLVARGTRQGAADLYPIGQQEPLPVTHFPLRAPDPDLVVDLQVTLAAAWKRGHFETLLRRWPEQDAGTGR